MGQGGGRDGGVIMHAPGQSIQASQGLDNSGHSAASIQVTMRTTERMLVSGTGDEVWKGRLDRWYPNFFLRHGFLIILLLKNHNKKNATEM